MNRLLGVLIWLALFSVASSEEEFDSHHLRRPLILEDTETQLKRSNDELQLQCTSWRFAVEVNNLNPWKTIPLECACYVKDYMTSRTYIFDLERVSMEAGTYTRSLQLAEDGMDAWIFDIDETLLSNLPYYSDHGFGALEDHGKPATLYKSEKRSEMVKEGYRILGNSGDQWSDLLGTLCQIVPSSFQILCTIFPDRDNSMKQQLV